MKKKTLSLLLALCLTLSLAACGGTKPETSAAPAEKPAEAETPAGPAAEPVELIVFAASMTETLTEIQALYKEAAAADFLAFLRSDVAMQVFESVGFSPAE